MNWKILYLLFFCLTLVRADLLKENFITFDLNGSVPKAVVDFESDNLERFMKLDDSGNGIVSWREIKAHRDEIERFVLSHVDIRVDGRVCGREVERFEVYRRVHQSYIRLYLKLHCDIPKEAIDLKYDLFFDVDKDQKAFVKIADDNRSKPYVMSDRKVEVQIVLGKRTIWNAFVDFFKEGVWHIWIGYDHILFLLMLLVPSVYRYRGREPVARERFGSVLVEILKIVTAFSVAHSITLGLSVSGIVTLDAQFVEVAIALSILFTALNNLYPIVTGHTWVMAFAFGLIHGFGFANVLREMIVKNSSDFLAMLFGFNLGVEAGQLVIVGALLPWLFWLRKSRFYRYAILYGFSLVAALVSLLWAIERAFGLSLLPF